MAFSSLWRLSTTPVLKAPKRPPPTMFLLFRGLSKMQPLLALGVNSAAESPHNQKLVPIQHNHTSLQYPRRARERGVF